jgi:hypothetical protein
MFYDVSDPDIKLSDWERFRKEFPQHLIDEVLGREQACLPDWFVPLAWGVGVASDALLQQVGYRHGMRRAPGWMNFGTDYFLYSLMQCCWP